MEGMFLKEKGSQVVACQGKADEVPVVPNVTQVFPSVEDTIMEEDIPQLSPIHLSFHASSYSMNKIGSWGRRFGSLREKSQSFKATVEEFFNEVLLVFNPWKIPPEHPWMQCLISNDALNFTLDGVLVDEAKLLLKDFHFCI